MWAEYIEAYRPGKKDQRVESERFKSFSYEDFMARGKANLDIIWKKDDSLDGAESLPAPEVIAEGIVQELQGALNAF